MIWDRMIIQKKKRRIIILPIIILRDLLGDFGSFCCGSMVR